MPFKLNNWLVHHGTKRNWIRGKSNSNFERSQDFRAKKSELTRDFDTWSIIRAEIKEKLNGSNFERSQDPMHIPTCDLGSFNGILSYLRVPPVPVEIQLSYGFFRKFILNRDSMLIKLNSRLVDRRISRNSTFSLVFRKFMRFWVWNSHLF